MKTVRFNYRHGGQQQCSAGNVPHKSLQCLEVLRGCQNSYIRGN